MYAATFVTRWRGHYSINYEPKQQSRYDSTFNLVDLIDSQLALIRHSQNHLCCITSAAIDSLLAKASMAQGKATELKRVKPQGSCCCVPYCSNRINGHRFPKSENMQKLWLKAIRRKNFTPKERTVVCHDHFRAEDYIIV